MARTLSSEEKDLWDKVKKTAKPLDREALSLDAYLQASTVSPESRPTAHNASKGLEPAAGRKTKVKPEGAPTKPQPLVLEHYGSERAFGLEQKTARRIAKGKIAIDGRIDLHGLTQLEAHGRLFRYLEEAWIRQKRTILVITGKGKGEGILRQAVPRWLSEATFRTMIGGVSEAHRTHGGEGALYVRLKRRRNLL